MIVVKVELWPGGDPTNAESLGIVAIANDGPTTLSSDPDAAQYRVELQQFQTGTTKTRPRVTRRTLMHWRHKGWVTLVRKAFEEVDTRG